MMIADMESINKRLEKNNKKNLEEDQVNLLEMVLDYINNNKNMHELNNFFTKGHVRFIS